MRILPFTCLEISPSNTEIESNLANHISSKDRNARLLFFFLSLGIRVSLRQASPYPGLLGFELQLSAYGCSPFIVPDTARLSIVHYAI